MLLRRFLLSNSASLHHRFCHSTAALALPSDPEAPLTYLDGHPKPDPKFAETIHAVPRSESGKKIAKNERKAGRLPCIVFEQKDGHLGGNKRLISVQINQIKKLLKNCGRSFFLSRLFDLQVRPDFDSEEIIENVRVLPRQVHIRAGTDHPINLTLIRAPSDALLKVDVPIVFRGEDASPGLRKGSYLHIFKRSVKYLCPADIIPPYIDVDLSELDVGHKVRTVDLNVHPALKLLDLEKVPVVKLKSTRTSEAPKSK